MLTMRPLLALLLVAATCLAETPPAPAGRTRAEFIAALRAAYEGKVNAAGEKCEVLVDPSFGRGVWLRQGNRSQRYASERLVPGDTVPALTCEGWLNTAGGPPATSGKVLWIEFSATWCGPCKQAMPRVQELYGKFKDKGLEAVVVTDEPAKVFEPYLSAHGYTMPAAVGTGRDVINGDFGVMGWPTAILVARDGRIAYVGDPRDEEIEKAIAGLVAK